MGSLHAQALRRGRAWTLAGVADLRPPRWDIPWSPDLRELLERIHPEAVVVAVPPQQHERIARICLEHGCHVLLEKPICPTAPVAQALADEFRRAGQVLFGGHSERFHPVFRAMVRELSNHRPLRLRCARQGPPPQPLPEGGAVLDLAIHDLDLVQRLVPGLRLEGVDRDEEGRLRAHLGAADGSRVEVVCAYGAFRRRSWIIESGTKIWNADFLEHRLERSCGSPVELPPEDALELEHLRFWSACRGEFDWWADLQPQIQAVELAREILEAESSL